MTAKARAIWLAPMCALLCTPPEKALGQQLDTAILSSPASESTILDQIDQPQERRAFAAVYKKGEPSRRLKAAQAFLSAYPDSWMLPEVYEAAAKAAVALGDASNAMIYAKESLRLLPENPLLLVPIANVQLQQNLLRDANRSAEDAL